MRLFFFQFGPFVFSYVLRVRDGGGFTVQVWFWFCRTGSLWTWSACALRGPERPRSGSGVPMARHPLRCFYRNALPLVCVETAVPTRLARGYGFEGLMLL